MHSNEPLAVSLSASAVSMEYSLFAEGAIRQLDVIDENGEIQRDYSYSYYFTDHLGSTRMVMTDGQFTEAVAYKPYGEMVQLGLVGGASVSEVREKFTRKEFDTEGADENGVGGIGAYYFGARYYDPEIGVFLSTDAASQYHNAYSYTGGNPIILVDEDGNFAFLAAPILWNAAISAVTDLGMQLALNGGKVEEVRWGSVAFSAVGGVATGGFNQLAAAGQLGTFLAGRGAGAFFTRTVAEGFITGLSSTIGEFVDRGLGREDKSIGDIWISAGLGTAVNLGKGYGQGLYSRFTGGSGSFDPQFDKYKRHFDYGGIRGLRANPVKATIQNVAERALKDQVKNRWITPAIMPDPTPPEPSVKSNVDYYLDDNGQIVCPNGCPR